jgi:hypothetical protein
MRLLPSLCRSLLVVVVGFALAATTTATAARLQPAVTSPSCTADQQAANQDALDAYTANMLRARRAYFRKHHKAAQRKEFVRRQQAKLRALRRAAACEIVDNPTPTPPPPAPTFQTGHYKGSTSQLTNFEFDVSTDGSLLQNLVTGQINDSCSPGNGSLYGGNLNYTGFNVARISSDGSFVIDQPETGTIGGTTPYTGRLTITGHLSGAIAVGTLLETLSFTYNGTAVSCTSNPQSWSAARTGP